MNYQELAAEYEKLVCKETTEGEYYKDSEVFLLSELKNNIKATKDQITFFLNTYFEDVEIDFKGFGLSIKLIYDGNLKPIYSTTEFSILFDEFIRKNIIL